MAEDLSDLWKARVDKESSDANGGVYIGINLVPLTGRPFPEELDSKQLQHVHASPPHAAGSRGRSCCSLLLQALLLLPLSLLASAFVLLPSALYFIPKHLLVNTFTSSTSPSLSSMTGAVPSSLMNSPHVLNSEERNCSEGFFYAANEEEGGCLPLCGEFRLDEGVGDFSIHRIVVIAASALSLLAALACLILALTLLRKEMSVFLPLYWC